MRGNLHKFPLVGVKFPSEDLDFLFIHGTDFQQHVACFFIRELQPDRIRKEGQGDRAGTELKTVLVVKRPEISPQVRDVTSLRIIEIHRQQELGVIGFHLEHDLFLPMEGQDAVGITEDI